MISYSLFVNNREEYARKHVNRRREYSQHDNTINTLNHNEVYDRILWSFRFVIRKNLFRIGNVQQYVIPLNHFVFSILEEFNEEITLVKRKTELKEKEQLDTVQSFVPLIDGLIDHNRSELKHPYVCNCVCFAAL